MQFIDAKGIYRVKKAERAESYNSSVFGYMRFTKNYLAAFLEKQ